MSGPLKNVTIIGAGVIGLTTGITIQEKEGYAVTIVAELFPTDPRSIRYTSLWAGAHHVSHADNDPVKQKIDEETFNVMWKLSEPGGDAEKCFMRLDQTEYYGAKCEAAQDPLSWMPNFKYVDQSLLPSPDMAYGVNFTTFTIDTPVYCNYLLSRFLAAGGQIVRATVQSISEIVEGGPSIYTGSAIPQPPDAVVVCAGLGARFLGGIEDKDCYPMRGQTIVVKAPWINFGRTMSNKEGLWTYIIPRRCGDVIVGGTKLNDDWYPRPRLETVEDILRRGFELCPELAPPEIRAVRKPTVDDVRPIIQWHGCGLRPARKGGVRIDVRWTEFKGRKVPIVSNYGHGGEGFQSSWGTASVAFEKLEQAITEV